MHVAIDMTIFDCGFKLYMVVHKLCHLVHGTQYMLHMGTQQPSKNRISTNICQSCIVAGLM